MNKDHETVVRFPISKDSEHPDGSFSLWDLPRRISIEDDVYSAGWPEFDRFFQLYPGQLVVISGIASHGKSTFAMNIISNLALEGDFCCFLYVPENEEGLLTKMQRMWRGSKEAFEYFAKYCCVVQSADRQYSSHDHTMEWILAKAHRELGYESRQLVLIDPWNELDRHKPKDMLLTDYIGWCLMQIKDFCRTTKRTVIVIAHPTKAVTENGGRTPTLADVEGSMNWFNKSDNGLILVREGDSARVISGKVREEPYAGRKGHCYFNVDQSTGIFTFER